MRRTRAVQGPPVVSTAVNANAIRVHSVTPRGTKGYSLAGIAEIYYQDRRRWVEIYNANRVGVRRPDGTMGHLRSPEDTSPGDILYIP